MARYPGARWRPLSETNTQARITPRQVILHSAVGSGSLHSYFSRLGVNLESHFWVGLDGTVEQYVDTTVRADANYTANSRAISIETADNGDPDKQPWTPAQVEAIAGIVAWAHRTHGIPLRQCPGPESAGIGWHTMWGAPGPWTPAAKSCPGKARIAQFSAVMSAAERKTTAPGPGPAPEEEDEMAFTPAELMAVKTTADADAVSFGRTVERTSEAAGRTAQRLLILGRMVAAAHPEDPTIQALAVALESTTYPGEL